MSKLNMTRRSFAKLAAAAAGATALAGTCGSALADAPVGAPEGDDVKTVRTCCRTCGKNECGVLVTVKNGRAIKVEGDADTAFHSMGNCCSKSQASIQAAYHPDRIYHPMKRTNPKGSADPGWVRISWEEAYQTIAEKFQEISD